MPRRVLRLSADFGRVPSLVRGPLKGGPFFCQGALEATAAGVSYPSGSFLVVDPPLFSPLFFARAVCACGLRVRIVACASWSRSVSGWVLSWTSRSSTNPRACGPKPHKPVELWSRRVFSLSVFAPEARSAGYPCSCYWLFLVPQAVYFRRSSGDFGGVVGGRRPFAQLAFLIQLC